VAPQARLEVVQSEVLQQREQAEREDQALDKTILALRTQLQEVRIYRNLFSYREYMGINEG